MADYVINIARGTESGTLTFTCGKVAVETTCWWNLVKPKIPAGTYTGVKTTMASSGFRAIWLEEAVGSKGQNDIFIHGGDGPQHSQGCIVANRHALGKIWDTIAPEGTRNIRVVIVDR